MKKPSCPRPLSANFAVLWALALAVFGPVARAQTPTVVDASFDTALGANGDVFALTLQPDGKVLIAGQFTAVQGVARSRASPACTRTARST